MVAPAGETPVLVLCADGRLRESLVDLLRADGCLVLPDRQLSVSERPAVVVAACDAWPNGWSLGRLRSTFRRLPCLMLSGSPLAGDFAVAQLPRGYFVRLPAFPGEILGLIAELSAA